VSLRCGVCPTDTGGRLVGTRGAAKVGKEQAECAGVQWRAVVVVLVAAVAGKCAWVQGATAKKSLDEEMKNWRNSRAAQPAHAGPAADSRARHSSPWNANHDEIKSLKVVYVRSKGALQNRGLSPKKKKSGTKVGGDEFLRPAGCTCCAGPDFQTRKE
jgi:hypothetical protein